MAALVGFSILPLVCWLVFALLLSRALAEGRGAIRVDGEISGSRDFIDRGRSMFVSEFRATTPDGREVFGTGSVAKSWKPTVGQRVKLLYRAHDRENPLVEAGGIRFLSSLIVGILALVFTAFIVVVAISPASEPSPHPSADDNGASTPRGKLRDRPRKAR